MPATGSMLRLLILSMGLLRLRYGAWVCHGFCFGRLAHCGFNFWSMCASLLLFCPMRPPRLRYDCPTAVCLCTVGDVAAGAAGEIMLLVLKKASLFCIGNLASNKSNSPRLIKLMYPLQTVSHAHPWFNFEILMLMRKLVRIDCINVDLARTSPVRRC